MATRVTKKHALCSENVMAGPKRPPWMNIESEQERGDIHPSWLELVGDDGKQR